jgi:uncharacterized coiled-coil DUF342 family protein
MDRFEKTAKAYDEAILSSLDYYNAEYNRYKNKMDDNHPFFLNIKNKIKELKQEIKYLKIK